MTTVIQDSDDESDLSSPLKLQECELQVSANRDRPGEKLLVAPPHTESTSSTEALVQEIENVRNELFGSPVSKRRQESSASGDSPTSLRAKRQRIVSSTKEAVETRLLEHRETAKTHGELIHPLHNSVDDGDHFSDIRQAGSSESSFDSICGQPATIFDFPNPAEGDKWELSRSVRNELVFAEASSTVPDNTLDQQHMIDEILAENYPIPAPAIQVNSESNSSIPWSTYIASQNRKSQTSSEPCDSVGKLSQDTKQKSAETDCDSNSDADQRAANAKSSRTFLRSEEAMPDNDITLEENRHESLENWVPTSAALTPSHNRVAHERAEDTRWAGRSPRAGQAVENDVQEAEMEQDPENIGVLDHAVEVLASEPKKKRQRSQLESDDAWIGLPKEQYKPRPSRSRSTRLHTDTIDLSIPPERAAQTKIKRRKTEEPAVDHNSSPLTTNIEAMGEMGFTPNRSREALTKSGGNLEQAIDELLTQPMSDCRVTASTPLFSDSQRFTGGMPPDAILPSVERLSHERSSHARRELLCVEVTNHHRRSRHDDAESRTIFVEPADANASPNDLVDEAAPVSDRRKTSRKHKRKGASLDEDGQDEVVLDVESGATSEDTDSADAAKHLQEIDANPKIAASDPANEVTKRDVTPVPPTKIALTSCEPTQNLTGEPKTKPANKASKSQSPISKGKVPYRVGLSRKARVASLLKVMKK